MPIFIAVVLLSSEGFAEIRFRALNLKAAKVTLGKIINRKDYDVISLKIDAEYI